MKDTKEGFLPYLIKILFSSNNISLKWIDSPLNRIIRNFASRGRWSQKKPIGQISATCLLFTLAATRTKHQCEQYTRNMIMNVLGCNWISIKRKSVGVFIGALILKKFSQISTNSPPPCCPLPVLVYPPWDMCVCSYRCYKLGPGLWKMAAPEVRALPTCSMELFFSSIFCLCLFCQKHHYHHLVFGCKSICLVERDAVLLTQCCVSTRPTDPKLVKKAIVCWLFTNPKILNMANLKHTIVW